MDDTGGQGDGVKDTGVKGDSVCDTGGQGDGVEETGEQGDAAAVPWTTRAMDGRPVMSVICQLPGSITSKVVGPVFLR